MLSLKERVFRDIRDRMLTGEIGPGSTVSETFLAKGIGVSRTPVREALVHLEALGLIEQHPRIGTRVRKADRADIEECFELREVLECNVTRVAAARITDAELDEIGVLLARYKEMARRVRTATAPADAKALSVQANILDMAFHLKIMGGAKNRRMVQMVSDAHLMTRILSRNTLIPSETQLHRVAVVLRQHHRIFRALRKRDADAAVAASQAHVRWSMKVHLAAFDWYARNGAEAADASEEGLYFPQNLLGLLAKVETTVSRKGGARRTTK